MISIRPWGRGSSADRAGGAGQQPRRDDGDVDAGPTRQAAAGRGLCRVISPGRAAWDLAGAAGDGLRAAVLLDLSDRDAAEAVRCRTAFKYALGPDRDVPGFRHSVLGDFRGRLLEDGRADSVLDLALARLNEAGLVRERTTQRTDSAHVLAAVRDLSRRYGRPVRLGKTPARRRPGSMKPERTPACCWSTWPPATLTCCTAPTLRPAAGHGPELLLGRRRPPALVRR